MINFNDNQDNDVVVKVPLREFIEINEKVRRYDRMMEVINNRRTSRPSRSVEVMDNEYWVR